MIKQLPDGRFRVDVRYPDGVRRTRTVCNEEATKMYEAIFLVGWVTRR